MRTTGNPVKERPLTTPEFKRHRLIMPVYVPNQDGYYRDALKIFEICIDSLLATVHPSRMDFTIVDNASIPEIHEVIEPHLRSGRIDQYIRNSINRGKADPLIGTAKSCYEPFISVSDADVLFMPGWLDRVEEIFEAFPIAGVVCPSPAPHLRHQHCTSTWLNHWFSLRRTSAVDTPTLAEYEKNLGIANFFRPLDWHSQWVMQRREVTALVGASHFAATYRREVFQSLNYTPQRMGLKGGLRQIEQQVDHMGWSRLSCPRNDVLHMGNAWEDWMKADSQLSDEFVPRTLTKGRSAILARVLSVFRPIIQKAVLGYDRITERLIYSRKGREDLSAPGVKSEEIRRPA